MVEATDDPDGNVSGGDLEGCPTLEDGVESLASLESASDEEQLEREVALLSVLADDTRYRILRFLLESDERCVCELDAVMEVSDSAISHALAGLIEADLVARRKEGRWRIYSATERAERLVEAVTEEVDT